MVILSFGTKSGLMLKKVATIIFDEGEPYKEHEMNIFPKTKITFKRVAKNVSTTLFKGDVKDLIYLFLKAKGKG